MFLKNESFTSISGTQVAYALLFDMNALFENYVAYWMSQVLGDMVRLQDSAYHLFTLPQKQFALRPDIVVFTGDNIFVLDTKWKLLRHEFALNYGSSPTDMYQMYVYHRKYQPKYVTLLYPVTDEFLQEACLAPYCCDERIGNFETKIEVRIRFVDLLMQPNEWEQYIRHLFQ